MKPIEAMRFAGDRTWQWLVFAAVVVFVLCSVLSALAHDAGMGWQYPYECCHDRDCSEISSSRVKTTPDGYLVDGRFSVSAAMTRPSPDGRFHACFPSPERLLCFFAPPSSY